MLALKTIIFSYWTVCLRNLIIDISNKKIKEIPKYLKPFLIMAYALFGVNDAKAFLLLLSLVLLESYLIINLKENIKFMLAVFFVVSTANFPYFTVLVGESSVKSVLYVGVGEEASELVWKACEKAFKKYPKGGKIFVGVALVYFGTTQGMSAWDSIIDLGYLTPKKKKFGYLTSQLELLDFEEKLTLPENEIKLREIKELKRINLRTMQQVNQLIYEAELKKFK
jgi:hypothetical protein